MKKVIVGLFILFLASPAFANLFGADVGITFIPTLTVGAYSSGQSMGGLQAINFFRSNTAPTGIFDNIFLVSKGGATTTLTIYIFDAKPSASTTCNDTSAFSLAAADIQKLAFAPFVLTPAIVGVGTTATVAQLTETISINNNDSPLTTKLYACVVAGGTVTPASSTDLVFTIMGVQD